MDTVMVNVKLFPATRETRKCHFNTVAICLVAETANQISSTIMQQPLIMRDVATALPLLTITNPTNGHSWPLNPFDYFIS